MNNQEAIKMLTAKVECMRRDANGTDKKCNSNDCDNCELCYMQGTMGEQQEALTIAISALEKQIPEKPIEDREFIKLSVRKSNGRPYYSIIYLELDDNGVGHDFEGYSSYSLDVISDYLKKYFMPPAQPKLHWIPCSERLPECSPVWRTEYLATVYCSLWKKKTKTMCVQWENVTIRGKEVSRWIWNNRLFPKEWEIIAWSPMPEPYKEGDE